MIKKLLIVAILLGIFYIVFSNKCTEKFQHYIDSHHTAKWAPSAQFRLATWLFFTRRYEKSLTSYQRLILKYPGYPGAPEALFRIAECYENLNEIESALTKYKEFVFFHPNHPWVTKANNNIIRLKLLK